MTVRAGRQPCGDLRSAPVRWSSASGRLLWYAARYSELFLGSSIERILNIIFTEHRRSLMVGQFMDALFRRAIGANAGVKIEAGTSFANFLLYIRGHATRMPAHLLITQLVYKGLPSFQEEK